MSVSAQIDELLRKLQGNDFGGVGTGAGEKKFQEKSKKEEGGIGEKKKQQSQSQSQSQSQQQHQHQPKKKHEEKKEINENDDDNENVQIDEEASIRLKTPRGTRDYSPSDQNLRNEMMSIIKKNFDKSGGQYLETPVIEIRDILMNKYGEDEKLIYELKLQDGSEELCLRYDLTVPLSRYVAMNRKEIKSPFKAARMGKVYRRDQPRMTKGRLREFWQCDFDIIRTAMPSNIKDLILDDMEIIALICQTLIDLKIKDFVIKLNNRKLLDIILEICGVSNEQVRSISSAIDKLDKREWKEVKKEMIEKGLNDECAEKIYSFVSIKGKPHEVIDILKKHKILQAYHKSDVVNQVIQELELLIQLLTVYHDDYYVNHVYIDMSMVRGLDYYTGIILEAVFTDEKKAEEIGSIAAGGRYDQLIQSFIPSQQFPCVGASIGFERIFSCWLEMFGVKSNTGIDILICEVSSKSSENNNVEDRLYIERLKLLKDLKIQHHFNCEIMNKFKPSFRDQINYAEDRNIKWLVIIGDQELANNTVNLRRLTLVGDRVILNSPKNSAIHQKRAIITSIDQPTPDSNKAPFIYVKLDDSSSSPIKITKKEIFQVVENNSQQTISDLQVAGLPRDQLISFFQLRLP